MTARPAALSEKTMAGLRDYLAAQENDYTPALRMLRSIHKSPGYHTRVPDGVPVHETRSALSYALLLLAEGCGASVARAAGVIDAVLQLQDVDPCSRTYGIWPWLQEEPLERMSPPDWNWADFCGVRLAHALACYRNLFPSSDPILSGIETALGHAAFSIFRRNVDPGYTNIAIKGAVVCSAAGELLQNPLLLHYGRTRLQRCIGHARHHEGFNEYNSPNYGHLVLTELERGLLICGDAEVRARLGWLHDFTWRQFARTFNPGTGQLCGPQSRAYQDILPDSFIRLLEAEVGVTVARPANHPEQSRGTIDNVVAELLIPRVPAPPDARETMEQAARQTISRRQFFIRSEREEECRVSTVWHSPTACIGSMNKGFFWVQQRPVLGYWRVENNDTGDAGSQVAVARVRLTHDGCDFASGFLHTCQRDNRLLCLAGFVTDKGDHHLYFDHPADGVFNLSQLALSVEVTAPSASVSVSDDKRLFTLAAGEWSFLVRPVCALLDGFRVSWEIHCTTVPDAGGNITVAVRALVNDGEPIKLALDRLDCAAIGFFAELLPSGAAPSEASFHSGIAEDRRVIRVHGEAGGVPLELSAPLKPLPSADS